MAGNARRVAGKTEKVGMRDGDSAERKFFAKKLYELMTAKGLSQSDVARAIWGTVRDARGRDVARNRDRISHYMRGSQMPEPRTLKALADLLGVQPAEFSPALVRGVMDPDRRADMTMTMGMTVLAGTAPMLARVQIDKVFPFEVATQLMAVLLAAEKAAQKKDTIQ